MKERRPPRWLLPTMGQGDIMMTGGMEKSGEFNLILPGPVMGWIWRVD